MPYGLTLVTPPACEPVTVAELREWCRVDGAAHDAVLAGLAAAARDLVEKLTGRALVTQTWRLSLDGFPWPGGWQVIRNPSVWPDPHTIRVPKAPLQSVASVTYYDMADALQTLSPAVYDVDAASDPGRVTLALGKTWPVTRPKPGAVRVTFVCGYGPLAVPESVKTAIKLTAAQWFENREASVTGTIATELPWAARQLLASAWNGELEYGM
jgi:uncharacterized phiE125 gp8 family phage protein